MSDHVTMVCRFCGCRLAEKLSDGVIRCTDCNAELNTGGNRLIYTETMSFACSEARYKALERLAKACVTKEESRGAFGLHEAGRALWLEAYAEYLEALAAVREAR